MKLSTFLIALLAMVSAFAYVTWQRLRVDLVEDLKNGAIEINEQAPIVLSPYYDVIGARADGKEIIYQFRVHGLSLQAMSNNEELLRTNKIKVAKEDKIMTRYLKSGAKLTYEYFVGNDLALKFSIEESSLEG